MEEVHGKERKAEVGPMAGGGGAKNGVRIWGVQKKDNCRKAAGTRNKG